MLTIFTTPKAFRGHIGIIQNNAFESWMRLRPRPEIIVFGHEEGAAQAAAKWDAQFVPDIASSDTGTPLVNAMFAEAERRAKNDLLCLINADIVLLDDFMQAIQRLVRVKNKLLMVGRRWDLDVNSPLDFGPDWQPQLKAEVAHRGRLHEPTGIDYFVFPTGLWQRLPPFAVGRVGYDNWLLYEARRTGARVIDATAVVTAVHQNHDYTHLPNGPAGIQSGPDALRNKALLGHRRNVYTIEDATWLLTAHGIVPALTPRRLGLRLWRRLQKTTRVKAVILWFWLLFRRTFGLPIPNAKPLDATSAVPAEELGPR